MNKSEFTNLIINPDKLGNEHIDTLKKIVADYPYFSTAQILLAKALFNTNHYEYEKQLKITALSVPNREILYQFLNNQLLDLAVENSLLRVSDEMKAEKVSRPDFELGKEEQEALLNEAQNIISTPLFFENSLENTPEKVEEKIENITDNFDFEEPILENIVSEKPSFENDINIPFGTETVLENNPEIVEEKIENITDNFDFEEPILENIVNEIPSFENEINIPVEQETVLENNPEIFEEKIENIIDKKQENDFQLAETEGTLVRFVNVENILPNFDESSLFTNEQNIETITKSVMPNIENYGNSRPILHENEESLIEQFNETNKTNELIVESETIENNFNITPIEAVINNSFETEIELEIEPQNELIVKSETIENDFYITPIEAVINNSLEKEIELETEPQNEFIVESETIENDSEITPIEEAINIPIDTEIKLDTEPQNQLIIDSETLENDSEITPIEEAINIPIDTEIELETEPQNQLIIDSETLENDSEITPIEAVINNSFETEIELETEPQNEFIIESETIENDYKITPIEAVINNSFETEIELETEPQNEFIIESETIENDSEITPIEAAINTGNFVQNIQKAEENSAEIIAENFIPITTDNANNLNFFEWLEISKSDYIETEKAISLEIKNYEDTAFVDKIKQIIKSKAEFQLNNQIANGIKLAHDSINPFEYKNNIFDSAEETTKSSELSDNNLEKINVESFTESVEEVNFTTINENEDTFEQIDDILKTDIYVNEVESILPDFEALQTFEVEEEKPYIIYDKKEGLIPNYETPAFDPLFNNNYVAKVPVIETTHVINSVELNEVEEQINFEDFKIDNNLFEKSFTEIYIPLPEKVKTIEAEKPSLIELVNVIGDSSKNEIENILEKFMRENPSISRPKTEFFNPASVAKTSAEEKDEIVSETLASIYLKQGLIKKSILTYEKLCLIYPLKSAYFAALIFKIKTEHNIN